MAISTGGLALTSNYELPLPVGSEVHEDANGTSPLISYERGTGAYDYFGAVNGFKAIRVDPVGTRSSVIAFTASQAVPVLKPVVVPPVVVDTTPFTQADIDAAVAAQRTDDAAALLAAQNEALYAHADGVSDENARVGQVLLDLIKLP